VMCTGSRSSSISSNRLSPQPRPLGSGPRPDSKLATSTTSDGEEEYHPSNGWRPRRHHLDKAALWERIRQEARLDAVRKGGSQREGDGGLHRGVAAEAVRAHGCTNGACASSLLGLLGLLLCSIA
jgi:hypothetical protein